MVNKRTVQDTKPILAVDISCKDSSNKEGEVDGNFSRPKKIFFSSNQDGAIL